MTGVDYRNLTFQGLRDRLDESKREVYTAWVVHGPGTTRELAEKSGIDLLTFRPRTTDLGKVGLVRVCGGRNGEGVYEAVPREEWELWRESQVNGQLMLI
jgi:hypothetical protein